MVNEAVVSSVRGGIDLVDTAINYRGERGERSVGAALRDLIDSGTVGRDELIVCSKGGFVPVADDPHEWFAAQYVRSKGLKETDLVAGCHSMHPAYLLDQLDRSLANLGLESLDIYYVHNPETQLGEVDVEAFYARLQGAFAALEDAVKKGKISSYGVATWNAFRVPPDAGDHVELARVKSVAGPNFRFVQLPLNLAMPEALLHPTQTIGADVVPALEAARRLGVAAISSGSMCQGRILGRLPPWLTTAISGLKTDALRALQFTRSAPGLLGALVGMKSQEHVRENLELISVPPLDALGLRRVLEAGA